MLEVGFGKAVICVVLLRILILSTITVVCVDVTDMLLNVEAFDYQ